MKLILLGIDPEDFRGEERLEVKLAKLKPDMIAIESSPKELEYHRQWYEQDDRHLQDFLADKKFGPEVFKILQAGVLHRSATPYWLSRAIAYGQQKGVKVYQIDSTDAAQLEYNHERRQRMLGSGYNHRLLRLVDLLPDGVGDAGLVLNDKDFAKTIDEWCNHSYEETAKSFTAEMPELNNMLAYYRGWLIGSMDEKMDSAARKLLNSAKLKASRLVVITKCQRLMPDPKKETLYSRLKDWNPAQVLLHEGIRKPRKAKEALPPMQQPAPVTQDAASPPEAP